MFVAKFSSTSGAPFVADKNGNYPMVGAVQSGVARNAIINGTIFQREGLKTNKLYLCDNTDDTLDDGTEVVNTTVISEISIPEFLEFRKEYGAGKLNRVTAEAAAEIDADA